MQLRFAGVCNAQDTLAASGTLLSGRYGGGVANRRPSGVRLGSLQITRPVPNAAGVAVATLRLAPGTHYPARRHVGSILLTDPAGEVVPLNSRDETTAGTDARGNLRTIQLAIPAGTTLPSRLRAYLILDVFPLGSRVL